MSIASPTTLLLATALSAPTLYNAAVTGTVEISAAATRFLIAVPVAAIMLWLLRMVTSTYNKPAPKSAPTRRAGDAADDDDEVIEGDPPVRPS